MTVITYSSAAGRFPKKIQVLEHPSACGNVPEPLSETLEPQVMLDHSENPIREPCGVKGQRWIGDERGAKGEKARSKRQTWARGVSGERMDGGRREEQCNLRNKCNKEVGKNLKSGRECVEGALKSKTDVSEILSVAETQGEIERREQGMGKKKRWPVFIWPFHLRNITEGEVERGKNVMKGMRRHHIFLWLILLLYSLCPIPASSQVRVAFESQLSFLIQRLWNNDC